MAKRSRQLLLLDALRAREAAGVQFVLDDLLDDTGYKLSTLRTYHTKRLRGVFIFDDDDNTLTARGVLDISDDAFLRHLDQTRASPSTEEALVAWLCERSVEHLELALTLYRRPSLSCRVHAFCRHMASAWELLLTADLAKEGLGAIEALDRGQLGGSLQSLASRGLEREEDAPVRENVLWLGTLCAVPAHIPLEAIVGPLSRLFQACVLNYGAHLTHVIGQPHTLGGLGGVLSPTPVDELDVWERRLGGQAVARLRALLAQLEQDETRLSNPRFAVPVGYGWQLAPLAPEEPIALPTPDPADEEPEQGSLALLVSSPTPLESENEMKVSGFGAPKGDGSVDDGEAAQALELELESLSDLLDAVFESVNGEELRLLRQRVDGGASLERLEADFGWSAQAIKARLGQILGRLKGAFGPTAVALLDPLLDELDECGGVLYWQDAARICGVDDLRRLGLALAIAGYGHVRRWRGEFLSSIPLKPLSRRLAQLGDELRSLPTPHVALLRVMGMAADIIGMRLPRGGMVRLLELAYGMEVTAEDVVIVRRTRADHLLELMRDHGAPAHFVQIVDLYRQHHPEDTDPQDAGEDGSPRHLEASLAAILRAQEAIYSVGRDTFVHHSALPVPPERLEETVAWCVEFMEGLTGAISPQRLLGELDRVGKDRRGLSAALLRDGLARHSDVVTFQNARLVAHVDSFREQGLTLEDWLERILKAHSQALTLPHIMALLPEGVHFHRTAVHACLLTAPWAILLGRGRFDHLDCLGLEGGRRRALIDTAVAALPENGRPVPCRRLLAQVRPMDPTLVSGHPNRALSILWGLLHKDARAQCGPGGMVARSRDGGARALLERAILEVLSDLSVARVREIHLELTARYGHGGMGGTFRVLLQELVEQGQINALPDGLFSLASPPTKS